jgi:hypothetical protein
MLLRRRHLLLLATSWATRSRAHSYKSNGMAIGHAWALPAGGGVDGQVFMPLLNEGAEADALLTARAEICAAIELRRNARYDDPAEARFDLPPGQPLAMRPTARHLRLMGLDRPLRAGDRFPLILDFDRAGEIEVEVFVEDEGGH